ncbi:hypothetical protein HK105_208067 [Polyrhizophydium stewartii]|uniref:Transmembrane protein n=1 Tax=Polyrhizophydium stewartii TaxID=2732419 RepID=A0ABR4MYX0_9FUNG|nr:hypothetical protein HK105_008097 [Polyrhizophydium stewartii]
MEVVVDEDPTHRILAIILVALLSAALFAVILWLLCLPVSRYIVLMRVACIFGLLSVEGQCAITFAPALSMPLTRGIVDLLQSTGTASFFIAELEFLKLMAPHIQNFQPHWVVWGQLLVAATGLANYAANIIDIFTEFQMRLSVLLIEITLAPLCIFDFLQQSFLLYFVLWRLKTATTTFRVCFAAIIVTGFAVAVISGIVIEGAQNSLNAYRLIGVTMYSGLQLLGALSMLLLRGVLAKRKRPPPAGQRSPRRLLSAKRLRSFGARKSRDMREVLLAEPKLVTPSNTVVQQRPGHDTVPVTRSTI